jgi:hypothetical protein
MTLVTSLVFREDWTSSIWLSNAIKGGKSVHLIAKSGTLVTIAGQNVFGIHFIPGREKPENQNLFED